MKPPFDFGITQEDPVTEISLLDLRSGDRLLCVASGGEMPLTILSLVPGVMVTAVDVSESQLKLCRLKAIAATCLDFPENAGFLGFLKADKKERQEIFQRQIHPLLTEADRQFWNGRMDVIEEGVINAGRFEGYIRRLRAVAGLFIGKKNLERLLQCRDVRTQEMVFDQLIAPRRGLRFLFWLAFHPAIYRKRGLSEEGLKHAKSNAGVVFFNKFRNFCIAFPAN